MRLSSEQVTQASAQDLRDLSLIYSPDESGAASPFAPHPVDEQQLHTWLTQHSGQIWAARFNARLLAAAQLGTDGELKHFVVRSITRRRGVGRFLLSQLIQHAAATGYSELYSQDPQATAFLTACGFQHGRYSVE